MAVHFTQQLVPVEDPPFLYMFRPAEHHFSLDTIAMVRHVICAYSSTTSSTSTQAESDDPMLVVALMTWWNSLPSTSQPMPWFCTDQNVRKLIDGMLQCCHMCHQNLLVNGCICTSIDRGGPAAAIVRSDLERLNAIVYEHHDLCSADTRGLKGKLEALASASSPAWTKAINSVLCQNLGWSFFPHHNSRPGPEFRVDSSINQMQAYHTLTANQSDGRGLSVLARCEALDVSDAEKNAVRTHLHTYLSRFHTMYSSGDGQHQRWAALPVVLHNALRAIETHERDMQCTLLASCVAHAFDQKTPGSNNDMEAIEQNVRLFLGPPDNYDEAYLVKWWNLPPSRLFS